MRATEIPIASPCGADWRTMKPSDRTRFCDACKKHVHDLSAMSAPEARALLASPPTEGLCVRYLYDAHGDIVFRSAPVPPTMLVRARRAAVSAAAVAFPMALAACMGAPARPLPAVAPDAAASATQTIGEPPMVPMMGAPAIPAPSASASGNPAPATK
jgi:hypothetical protein